MKTTFFTLIFVAAVSATAVSQDLANFRRLLLPVSADLPIPGAGGSTFSTETNTYSTVPCTYWPADSSNATADRFATLPPFSIGGRFCCVSNPSKTAPQTRYVFVDPQCYDNAKFTLTVVGPGGRATMPVVREEEFHNDVTEFLGIPILLTGGECTFSCEPAIPVYRHRVRVVNDSADPTGEVIVKLWLPWGSLPRNPDAQYDVHLDQRDGSDPSFPFYGEVNVDNPCLRQNPHGCVPWIGRIEVLPVSAGLRYWAFVSSTNNSTQQVQISLPQ